MGGMSAPSPGRFVALRHRDHRLIWAGNFVSIIGTQMQLVAINWHIYKLLEGAQLRIRLFGREIALNSEALGLGGVGLATVALTGYIAWRYPRLRRYTNATMAEDQARLVQAGA